VRAKRTATEEGRIGLDEAARRAGLHYMTVYRHVRTGRLPALQRGGRWWVMPTDLARLTVRQPAGPGARPLRDGDGRRRLLGRLVAADYGGAWALVEERLARGASPADVYLRLLGPALHEIGERWAAGDLSVEAEHRASAVALRLVGRLAPRFAPRGTPRRGTVVMGGAPGDPHLLPVAMAVDLLRARHLRVVDLGANVPTASFCDAAAAAPDLRAVGVSLSDGKRAGAAASALRAVRRSHPGVLLLAGGPAVPDADAALALGADDWAPDGLAFADLLADAAELRGRRAREQREESGRR
jgi:MerR family transcriptional regulator, light-induced transcriptional regulator